MLTSGRRWLRIRWFLPDRPVSLDATAEITCVVAAALDGALLLLVLPRGREEWSSLATSSLGRSGIRRGERLRRWPAGCRHRNTRAAALYPSEQVDAQ